MAPHKGYPDSRSQGRTNPGRSPNPRRGSLVFGSIDYPASAKFGFDAGSLDYHDLMPDQVNALRPTSENALLLIADGATGGYPLDTIRLMKGAFFVDQLGPDPWCELFSFRPYRFGPFDSSVYTVRDGLVRDGLLERHGAGRYATYSLTDAGRVRAGEVGQADQRIADWLRNIGRWVTGKSFSDLLKDVYERYPEFATQSVMR